MVAGGGEVGGRAAGRDLAHACLLVGTYSLCKFLERWSRRVEIPPFVVMGTPCLIGSSHIKEQQRTHQSARFGAMTDASR
jgi:hypothetical protein